MIIRKKCVDETYTNQNKYLPTTYNLSLIRSKTIKIKTSHTTIDLYLYEYIYKLYLVFY